MPPLAKIHIKKGYPFNLDNPFCLPLNLVMLLRRFNLGNYTLRQYSPNPLLVFSNIYFSLWTPRPFVDFLPCRYGYLQVAWVKLLRPIKIGSRNSLQEHILENTDRRSTLLLYDFRTNKSLFCCIFSHF